MNHANAGFDRIIWVFKIYGLAVDQNFATVWALHAIQNLHYGGFACTVFANKSVNSSSFYAHGDIFISDDPWEALGDVPQFYSYRHVFTLP